MTDLVLLALICCLSLFGGAFYLGTIVGERRQKSILVAPILIAELRLIREWAAHYQVSRGIVSTSLNQFVAEIERGEHRKS